MLTGVVNSLAMGALAMPCFSVHRHRAKFGGFFILMRGRFQFFDDCICGRNLWNILQPCGGIRGIFSQPFSIPFQDLNPANHGD